MHSKKKLFSSKNYNDICVRTFMREDYKGSKHVYLTAEPEMSLARV